MASVSLSSLGGGGGDGSSDTAPGVIPAPAAPKQDPLPISLEVANPGAPDDQLLFKIVTPQGSKSDPMPFAKVQELVNSGMYTPDSSAFEKASAEVAQKGVPVTRIENGAPVTRTEAPPANPDVPGFPLMEAVRAWWNAPTTDPTLARLQARDSQIVHDINSQGVMAPTAPAQADAAATPGQQQPAAAAQQQPTPAPAPAMPAKTGGGGGGGALGQLNAATKQQIDALNKAAEIGSQRAAMEGAAAQESYAQQLKLEQTRQTAENARQQFMRDQLGKLQQYQAQMEHISTHIDPDRLWASKDTGQRILAGIGVFLGGLGGGTNQALGVVNDAINRDIDAQKSEIQANLAKGRQLVDSQSNLMGAAMKVFGDERIAEDVARKTALELAAKQLEAKASQFVGPEMKAKAQLAAGQIRAEAAKTTADIQSKWEELALKRAELAAKMAALQMRSVPQRTTIDGAIDAVDRLKQARKSLPTGASLAQLWGGTDSANYQAMTQAFAPLIGQAISGSQRGFTPEQAEAFIKRLPGAGTKDATADQQLDALRNALVARKLAGGLGGGAANPNGEGYFQADE